MMWLKTALIASLASAVVMWFGTQVLGVPPRTVWIVEVAAMVMWVTVHVATRGAELVARQRKRGRGRSQTAREGAQ